MMGLLGLEAIPEVTTTEVAADAFPEPDDGQEAIEAAEAADMRLGGLMLLWVLGLEAVLPLGGATGGDG